MLNLFIIWSLIAVFISSVCKLLYSDCKKTSATQILKVYALKGIQFQDSACATPLALSRYKK